MNRTFKILPVLGLLMSLLLTVAVGSSAGAQEGAGVTYGITVEIIEDLARPATCEVVGYAHPEMTRQDCGRARVTLAPADPDVALTYEIVDPTGTVLANGDLTSTSSGTATVPLLPDATWAPGNVEVRVAAASPNAGSGVGTIVFNTLEVSVSPGAPVHAPGDDIAVSGTVNEYDLITCCTENRTPVPAEVQLQLVDVDGSPLGDPVTVSADDSGAYTATIPGTATAGLAPGPAADYRATLALVASATYDDPVSGAWAGTARNQVVVQRVPDTLLVEAKFVSSTGWVQPGDTYPFRVLVRNLTDQPQSGAVVTVDPPSGARFLEVKPLRGAGTATVDGGSVRWEVGTVAGAADGVPVVETLIVQAQALSAVQDPRIVWKDLSATAELVQDGATATLTSETHGPKVIPDDELFETARYGDKPFPIVPVDYTDRKHAAAHDGQSLERVVNSPDVPGSTFNLYQEMSYGQLYPIGEVPSADIATAGWDYEPGFAFTEADLTLGTCRGATLGPLVGSGVEGSPLLPERISGGWYQMPGNTEYYGGDYPVFDLGVAGSIDGACGPTSKSVYDAAVIADPEIDYNQFDSDKDGVVDFFMMVFTGIGGNGDSQINGTPPYDNIWPHSSSLEFTYEDPESGLAGYISDDQLTDLEGTPQCWLSEDYSTFDDCAADGGQGDDALPAYVRVGPYNVNPEDAIEAASVISHEYGHHLGLPDFYSSYSAYDNLNLMAADYSQHMTIFSKQELGWVVPRFVQPGEERTISDWEEIKNDTGEIEWRTPSGEPYTLSAANGDQNIHNGEAYGLKLPRKLIIDPAKVEEQVSAPWIWYSGRGNDFGCPPKAGHNLDLNLTEELKGVEPGTPVTLRFKSSWDIEWDWDYGFTMITTDGKKYEALPSQMGYTTDNSYNPNGAGCFDTHNNGLTGLSGSYQAGTETIDRNPAEPRYDTGSPFLDDEYDISGLAGADLAVVRFSYFTDPAFDRPGWFIDDLEVLVDGEVVYTSDASMDDPLHWFPGGCGDEGQKVAASCTAGWSRIKADAGAPLDHGYYLELRDRSGFDFDGRGQSDRGAITWEPGVFIEYTDESHGYGNNGVPQPPAQHYLDSQPQPGYDCDGDDPIDQQLGGDNCLDVSFTTGDGDSHFDDRIDDDGPWFDNFDDPSTESGFWEFGYRCLELDVVSMAGEQPDEALPSDLTADAVIRAMDGCVEADYGTSAVSGAPVAVAQAKPTQAAVGEDVTFDASRSSDDEPSTLAYSWDFGDGTTGDGQTVRHAYTAAGTYTATLTVVDADGNAATDTVEVTVTSAPGGGSPLPATGGGLALLGLLAIGGAVRLRRG